MNTSYTAANGLQVEVKGAPGRYFSALISLLPQSYPSYAFECAMLLGWGWRAFERLGGGVCIVCTAGKIHHRISIAVRPRLKRRRGGVGQVFLTRTPRCSCLASPLPKCGGGRGGEGQEAAFGVSREARGRAPRPCLENEEEDDASIPAPWTDADEAGLMPLRNKPIEMADTLYGRFLAM